jgi:hypothetical protein
MAEDRGAWPHLSTLGDTAARACRLGRGRAVVASIAGRAAAEVREGCVVAPRDAVKTCRPCGLQSLWIGSVASDANDGNGDV